MIAFLILCLIGSYLLGSLNASIIFSKAKGEDIRNSGSKNAGLTNALRVFGKKAAAFVFVFDLLKGIVAVWLFMTLANRFFTQMPEVAEFAKYMASLGAVLGHNFPLYFGFKGGKGILTSWGVIIMLDWRIAIILAVIFAVIVSLTRYVSLSSLAASAAFPISVILFTWGEQNSTKPYYIALALMMGALAIYRHKANISRLLTGTESKLGAKKE